MDMREAQAEILSATNADATNAGQGEGSTNTDPASPAGDKQPEGQDAMVDPLTTDKTVEANKAKKTDETLDENGKPLPFDKHPKWIAARQTEAKVQQLLDKYGFESMDELTEKLETGVTLKEIMGDRDAKSIIEKADKLTRYEEYWKQQELLKKEQEESPEETIARLKAEKDEIIKNQQKEIQTKTELEKSQKAVSDYNDTVTKTLTAAGLQGEAANLAKLVMAIDNPLVDLSDITDKKAVKAAADQVLQTFKGFVEKIEQGAVERYAAGKGKIPAVPAQGAAATDAKVVDTDNKNLMPADMLARANDEVLTILRQARDAMDGV